jgi:hypothetical protein
MKNRRYGMAMAVKEHLHSGEPITRLEGLILFGVSNLTDVISEMRKEGWTIQSRSIPFAAAVKRVNEYAVLEPPKNLPVREIQLTEYWMSK